jgi:hypothetical protein
MMRERDAMTERWLREEVAPAFDAYKADPSKAKPLAEVSARLDAFMAADKAAR